MQQLKVVDDNGQEIVYTFPENWYEVTTKQYKQLRTEYTSDDTHFLEIMTGVPRSVWYNQPTKFVEDVMVHMSWVAEKQIEFDKLKVEDTVVINENTIPVPKDLGLLSFGQKMLVDTKVKEFIDQYIGKKDTGQKRYMVITLIDYIVAVYLCPGIVGKEKFDAGDLERALLYVNNTPAYLIYPVAGFFLRKCIDSIGIGKTLKRLERRKMQRKKSSAKRPGQKG